MKESGVDVKMITGDAPETAVSIGKIILIIFSLFGRKLFSYKKIFFDEPRSFYPSFLKQYNYQNFFLIFFHEDPIGFSATQMGFFSASTDTCLTGPQLDEMSDDQLQLVIRQVSVFCRAAPRHKLKIVKVGEFYS